MVLTTFYGWASPSLPEQIDLDCYLPTGVLVPLKVAPSLSLTEIKDVLFREAKDYPLFGRLVAQPGQYCFVCINDKGKRERLLDESLSLVDVKPFRPVLKLVEKDFIELQGKATHLDAKIKFLMRQTPAELEDKENEEIYSFRQKYVSLSLSESRIRRASSWDVRAVATYPMDICDTTTVPHFVTEKLVQGHFRITVYLPPGDDNECLNVPFGIQPVDVIYVFKNRTKARKESMLDIKDYVLKIIGRDEYFLGEYTMEQFTYIRDCIAKCRKPELSIVPKSSLVVEDYVPMTAEASIPPRIPPKTCLTVWEITARFKFKISHAQNISIAEGTEIGVRAGLYHGSQSLCAVQCSREKPGPKPVWNEYLEFDICMCDIPRMAKLCLTIYSKRKGKITTIPLAWVNMTLFDFRNYLRQGPIKLHAWPVTDNLNEDLNVIGTVVSNINTSTSPCLFIEFTQYAIAGTSVIYPPFDKVLEKASKLAGQETEEIFRVGVQMSVDLQQLTEREPLAKYSEEEKKNIWFFRFECRDKYKKSLPKVLCSINWNNQEDVARMQALLRSWPEIAPEQALELLDYKYPEQEVRSFAVQCLDKFSDGELHLYLLQLVQVLKYEAYLDCCLAEFLLKRALWNRKIGHSLFWLLRAEMHLPEVSVRFGLLLESYCRGSVAHMAGLSKQVEAMNKLKAITELLQCSLRKAEKEKCVDTMKECLRQVTFREAFSNFHSVVDPSCKLRNLREEECKMMDSKMRPLWMVYENDDDMGCPTKIIFKNGDDLRQDMLTVQIFRIMDAIWQREGLNLEMTPYAVLPTGDKIGVIEVVTKAQTLANIQKTEGGVVRGAFTKTVLLDWLKKKNKGSPEMLGQAVERFTLSCAGYCVATYVLGIGDRHSDNIMVKETGELVHIDFGHFLGNFKVKFGMRRERVPFILSREFVYVITNGKDNGKESDKCEEFKRFREICEKAYLALRHHSGLFINLFAMMLATGLPELRSVEDMSHLKKTLGLAYEKNKDKDEKSALEDFRKKFNDAYKNSLSTSLNWAVHNWARDNK